jgi:hypothetical protein
MDLFSLEEILCECRDLIFEEAKGQPSAKALGVWI